VKIRIFKVDLTETNKHLKIIGECLLAICRNYNIIVGTPPEVQEFKTVSYTASETDQIIQEHRQKK
jgi:hypothetical protein